MNKIAFIYPGQGAQKAGMGKDFYAYSPLAAEMYDKASEILNIDMKALCFEENDLLDQTEYTQAAMVTTCLAMTLPFTTSPSTTAFLSPPRVRSSSSSNPAPDFSSSRYFFVI